MSHSSTKHLTNILYNRTIELKASYSGDGISFGEKLFMDKAMLIMRADIGDGADVSLTGQVRLVDPALSFLGTSLFLISSAFLISIVFVKQKNYVTSQHKTLKRHLLDI